MSKCPGDEIRKKLFLWVKSQPPPGAIEARTGRDVVGRVEGLLEGGLSCIRTEDLASVSEQKGELGFPVGGVRFHAK